QGKAPKSGNALNRQSSGVTDNPVPIRLHIKTQFKFPRASITVHQVSGQGGDALLKFHTVFSYKRALQLKHPTVQFSAEVPRAMTAGDVHCFISCAGQDGTL